MQTRTVGPQAGHTLPELLVALTLAGLLVTQSIISFTDWRSRQQLFDSAERFRLQLQQARLLAMARQMPVRLQFARNAHGSCYRMVLGPPPACGCADPDCPAGGSVLAQAFISARQGQRVAPTGRVSDFRIEPTLGTLQPTLSVDFSLSNGTSIRQIVNLVGRVRSCSPQGRWHGLPAC